MSEEREVKVTTYGIERETLGSITQSIFANMILRLANLGEDIDEENLVLLELMMNSPTQARMLIMSAVVFTVGNFSRINKVELTGMVDILNPGEIIDVKEAKRPGVA